MSKNIARLNGHPVGKTVFLTKELREQLCPNVYNPLPATGSGSCIVVPYLPNIFDPCFPGAQIELITLHGRYISQNLTLEWFEGFIAENLDKAEWSIKGFPSVISTPTGSGKNTFVLHVVRTYAASKGLMILLIVNRKALATQMMREADKAVNPAIHKSYYPDDATEYTTGSITLMTYHHYYELLCHHGSEYFSKFSIVIADEAHFFATDALFNSDTSYILDSIPCVFSNCVRIYMTATPEEVIDPIYAAEWRHAPWVNDLEKNALRDVLTHELYHLDRLPKIPVFTMPWDFSGYDGPFVFSKADDLIREIKEFPPSEKGIIFVDSKKEGQRMCHQLNSMNIPSAYLDSGSRYGNRKERRTWEDVVDDGNLGKYRVLIATSVLDNGFSIHDKAISFIALFTDDRTTFLQELGRVRLERGQKVRVYFSKMDKTGSLRLNKRQDILDAFALFYGNKAIPEYPYPDAEIQPSPNGVLELKTAPDARDDLGYVSSRTVFLPDGSTCRKPYINDMARWVANQLGKQAEEYDRLLVENPKLAPILYKARWLAKDPMSLTFENLHYIDINVPSDDRAAEKLAILYAKYEDTIMAEPKKGEDETEESQRFEEFSSDFQDLYLELCPYDKSVNNGKNREPWKHVAIQNHMKKLNEKFGKNHPEVLRDLNKRDDGCWWLTKAAAKPAN